MSRYTGSTWKLSRRCGYSTLETGKELVKRPYAPGPHGKDKRKKVSEYGKQCVTEFVNRGIIIDISHASDKTFYDVAEITSAPIVASHSNARKICSHRRNLTDEQLTEIIKREGIVGINFHKDFLNNDKTEASLKDVLLHTEYILSLDGKNAVCIGSDFDGADPINELNSIRKISDLYESYIKIGYNEQLVQKIMYYNAYNFFSRF